MTEFREKFDAEMTKQGRSIKRTPGGGYEDYASAVMWSWALWGFEQRETK